MHHMTCHCDAAESPGFLLGGHFCIRFFIEKCSCSTTVAVSPNTITPLLFSSIISHHLPQCRVTVSLHAVCYAPNSTSGTTTPEVFAPDHLCQRMLLLPPHLYPDRLLQQSPLPQPHRLPSLPPSASAICGCRRCIFRSSGGRQQHVCCPFQF